MRASLGGRGGVRPPHPGRGSGAQGPRHTQGSRASLQTGMGVYWEEEVAGTAGGPVCRAPLRWGSDLAPCPPPPPPPGDPAPASENTEQVPVDSGRRPPQGIPRTGGDSMPRPRGRWGPALLLPGGQGPRSTSGANRQHPDLPSCASPGRGGREPPRAKPGRAGPGLTPWPWVPRDAVSARRAQPQEGEGGAVLRG